MANYYLDFVGLNTFIYEPVGFDPDNQISDDKTSREAHATAAGNLFAVELNTFSAQPVIFEASYNITKTDTFHTNFPTQHHSFLPSCSTETALTAFQCGSRSE